MDDFFVDPPPEESRGSGESDGFSGVVQAFQKTPPGHNCEFDKLWSMDSASAKLNGGYS